MGVLSDEGDYTGKHRRRNAYSFAMLILKFIAKKPTFFDPSSDAVDAHARTSRRRCPPQLDGQHLSLRIVVVLVYSTGWRWVRVAVDEPSDEPLRKGETRPTKPSVLNPLYFHGSACRYEIQASLFRVA